MERSGARGSVAAGELSRELELERCSVFFLLVLQSCLLVFRVGFNGNGKGGGGADPSMAMFEAID